MKLGSLPPSLLAYGPCSKDFPNVIIRYPSPPYHLAMPVDNHCNVAASMSSAS